jgi:YtcA family
MSLLTRRVSAALLLGQAVCSTGCSGAPSVTIAGAYFPAWLLCALVAMVAAVLIRVLMVATGLSNYIPYQLAVCCSAGAIVALILWHLWVV